ncbi:MAG: hypothetical protein J7L82_05685, partial [Staphylothermus sp.]|nr:hypothetical protein [Staphylothermus sp.]
DLIVCIPTSILKTEHGLLLKTFKIYQIIRFSSIFGVSEIVFYKDHDVTVKQHNDYFELIYKIWKYLLTPPYLRRKLIPIDKDLKYVGFLPPLRLEVYDVDKSIEVGDKRIGYITNYKGKLYADIGLNKLFRVEAGPCKEDEFAYVEVVDTVSRRVVCLDHMPYMGPVLAKEDGLKELINDYFNEVDIIIATSKYGKIPNQEDLLSLKRYSRILILFGGPRTGLYEIFKRNGLDLEKEVDFIWNTIPGQKVKTIRTEEALISTLAVFNIFIHGRTYNTL